MTYYIKIALACFLLLSVAMSQGAIAALGATDLVPSSSSTSNVGHYSTNSYNGGSVGVSGAKDDYHASCTCESSAGSNNGSPVAGTWEGGSSRWGHWGSGGGSSGSGNYDGAYKNWRGYGSFGGSTSGKGGGGSTGGYNP